MTRDVTAESVVAGVVGAPIRQSLSPLIHNAWLAAAGVDGIYVAFAPPADGFRGFVEGLRGGAIRGLNVTAPFKIEALAAADEASAAAAGAGSANLLLFEADGRIVADSTDGEGLLRAIAEQAPGFDARGGPAVILGAGGAARAAATALIGAGAPQVFLVDRTSERAQAAAAALGGARLVVNALPAGASVELELGAAARDCVVMDMVYRPLRTPLLAAAEALGLRTVDGLAMLIAQARPSYRAFFGLDPPADFDVRALAAAAC
jgi:shikimate dehydrogenase